MNVSIQTKFFFICVFLVLLTVIGLSSTYYYLTQNLIHQESQARIQIALDMILDNVDAQLQNTREKFETFFQQEARNSRFAGAAYLFLQEENHFSALRPIAFHLTKLADELRSAQQIAGVDRLRFYDRDGRLLLVYQDGKVGGYVQTSSGEDSFLPMDDPALQTRLLRGETIRDTPLPEGIAGHYDGQMPESIITDLFDEGQRLGIRTIAPVQYLEKDVGILVGDLFFRQELVERYAVLSKTAINFFAQQSFSVGTLAAQDSLENGILERLSPCASQRSTASTEVLAQQIDAVDYYQGQCALENSDGAIGAVTISLAQDVEDDALQAMSRAMLSMSCLAVLAAICLSYWFGRKPIRSLKGVASVIGEVSQGDLRNSVVPITRDEIGIVAASLGTMIDHLRMLYGQIQHAANVVSEMSKTILQDMQELTKHMEQQSTTVDNTTDFVERVNEFVAAIETHSHDQLSTAEQVLSSIHQIRASMEEVTTNTGHLASHTQEISSSVEHVNTAVQHIAENSEHLSRVAQETVSEMKHIDDSFQHISQNAGQSELFARETMHAAQSGQNAVESSIQGMLLLKQAISSSAEAIQDVNAAGEQISSILDIVDDITEQTSLLSLNASIISAQAGEGGRGFAVVANEIKELALRTKSSTKEIASLIHTLQAKTKESVTSIGTGLDKADEGLDLVSAVKEELHAILERATQSSSMASETANFIQQMAGSSQAIKESMESLTTMVMNIGSAIQQQEQNIAKVGTAVERIRHMSGQVNLANREQNKASEMIVNGMEQITGQLSDISSQSRQLKASSEQVLEAMHTIELITTRVLSETVEISTNTAHNMDTEISMLKEIVTIFKVS